MTHREYLHSKGSGLAVIITIIAVVAVAAILYIGFNYFESQKVVPEIAVSTTTSSGANRSADTAAGIGLTNDTALDADITALDESMNGASDENAKVDGYLQDSADTFN